MVTDAPPALRLRAVRKRFPGSDVDAVQALDLDVPRGAIVSSIGPSRCGKTTTLRTINRLIEPSGGRIELEGTDVTDVPATHNLDEAIRLADRIALLNVGGVIEQYASPDELLRAPANEFVAEFIGDDRSMRRLTLATVGDRAATRP